MKTFQILTEGEEIVTIKGDDLQDACVKANVKPMILEGAGSEPEFVRGLEILKEIDFNEVNKGIDYLIELVSCGDEFFGKEQSQRLLHLFSMMHHIKRSSAFAYKAHKTL